MMNKETRERYDFLIQYLMNYCLDHEISVVFSNKLPPYIPSKSYKIPGELIVVNGNWHNEFEVPFMFAHEIGHIQLSEPYFYHATEVAKIKGEYAANVFAINLLLQYCNDLGFSFSNYYRFGEVFGIPKKLFYLLEKY